MKNVKVCITRDGKARVETSGFTGGACSDVIAKVQEALGATELSNQPKAEFFACETEESLEVGN